LGSGQIETIQIGGNNTNITEWITDVAFDVAQWLTQNSDKGYNYASSVINSGNQNDINALLAIYKGSSATDYSHSEYY